MARSLEFARLVVTFEAETKGLKGELDSAEKNFDRLTDFIKKNPLAATGALGAAAVSAGLQLAKMAEETNRAIGIITDRVPGATGKIDDFRRAAGGLAITFGVTLEEAIATMDAVSRAGVSNGEELLLVTRAAIEAGKALGKNGEELVGGLDAALDIFGISADNARAVMAQFFSVAGQGKTSVEDLLDTVVKLAPAIEGTGLDFLTTTRALGELIDQGFLPGRKAIEKFTEKLQVGGTQAIRDLAAATTGAVTEIDSLSGVVDENATAIRDVADAAAGPDGAQQAMDKYTDAVNRNTKDIESNTTRAQTKLKLAMIELGDRLQFLGQVAGYVLVSALGGGWSEAARKAEAAKKEMEGTSKSATQSFKELGQAGGTATAAAGGLTDVLIEAKNATQELGTKSVEELKKYQAALIAAKDAGTLDKEGKTALIALTKELARREKERAADLKRQAQEQSARLTELVRQYNELLKPAVKLTEEGNKQREHFADQFKAQEEVKDGADELLRLREKTGEILRETRETTQRLAEKEAERAAKARNLVESIKDVAQGLVGVGQAAGVFDDELVAALNNALAIGDAIADISFSGVGVFDPSNFSNLISIAGSLVGVMSSLFGESAETRARKRLLEENTDALRKLTDVQGDLLRINQPGAKLSGAEQALESLFSSPFVLSIPTLGRELAKFGLTVKDLDEIAESFGGIQLRNPETGKLDREALRLLLEALKTVDVNFQDTFQGELDRIQTLIEAGILKPSQEMAALLDLLTRGEFANAAIADALKGIDVFADPEAGIEALQDLIRKFDAGELTKEDLGGLTGQEFLDAILDLINFLRDDQEDEKLGSSRDPFSEPGTDQPEGQELGDLPDWEPMTASAEAALGFYDESLSISEQQLAALEQLVSNTAPKLVAAPSVPTGGGGFGGGVVIENISVSLSALPGEPTEDVARRAGEIVASTAAQQTIEQIDQQLATVTTQRKLRFTGGIVLNAT